METFPDLRKRSLSAGRQKRPLVGASPLRSSPDLDGRGLEGASLAISIVALLLASVSLILQIHDRHESQILEKTTFVKEGQSVTKLNQNGYKQEERDMYSPRFHSSMDTTYHMDGDNVCASLSPESFFLFSDH